VHEDNQGCIKLSKNSVMKERTKHIDIAYHFVREMVKDKVIELEYCPTNDMFADILTKSVSGLRLKKIAMQLGLSSDGEKFQEN
jgi:hypothetical protein